MSYRIGLDIGIGSCGWSVLKTDKNGLPYKIINLGSVVFPNGEVPKTGGSMAAQRRGYRASRRLKRRRSRRKHRVTRLFINHGLLTKHQAEAVFKQKPMPSVYELRSKGLKQSLRPSELYQVLYYLAGHRGFHSNRKYARKNAGKLIKSIHKSQNWINESGYQTVGEMLNKDKRFINHKHNSQGDYLINASRSMIDKEAQEILNIQCKLNSWVTGDFYKQYMTILDSQRNYDGGPAKQSPFAGNQIEKMIGKDTFDHSQERAAKATFTFEYYRLLTKLNNLAYKKPFKQWLPLDSKQKQTVIDLAFKYQKVTYKQIKKALKLDDDVKFNLIYYSSYKNVKQADRSTFTSMKATHEISNCLPEPSNHNTELIDTVGEILTKFASDESRIEAFTNYVKLPKAVISKLLNLNYSTFGKLSLKTMRTLIAYLKQGDSLDGAIKEAGYTKKNKVTLKYVHRNVKNPVVMRSFTITRKVVKAIINRYGQPDYINVELARDLAKSRQDRNKFKRLNEKRAKKNRVTARRLQSIGVPVNGQNILIDNLYHEQKGIDPYTGKAMQVDKIFSGMYYNIDHIVPYSWTFNDSYTNKVLTSAKANEDKADRIPMWYLLNKPKRKNFLIYFANNYIKSYKKRLNLLKNHITKGQLKAWKTRNLNDTRYMCRLIANYLEQNVKFSDNPNLYKIRVFRSNGSMTAKLRHRWGLVKIRANGDKHHALDATVIASITPALIKRVNDFAKYREIKYNPKLWKQKDFEALKHRALTNKVFKKFFNSFPLPWRDFRKELEARLSDDPVDIMKGQPWDHYTVGDIARLHPIHVVRVVSHKINGKVSGDTLRSAKYLKRGWIMSRAHVDKLRLNKKGQIKAGHYVYHKTAGNRVVTNQLVKQLQIHGNKGSKAFPDGYMSYRDNGGQHVIKKVKVFKKYTGGLVCHNAVKDNGKIVRIDVFKDIKKKKSKGKNKNKYEYKYCYVPIYLKDTILPKLPNKLAGRSKKPKYLTDHYKFEFSLYPYTPVYIEFNKPRPIKWDADNHSNIKSITKFHGYYRNAGVQNSCINITSFDNSYHINGNGIGGIKKIVKLNISYLGQLSRVHQKKRMTFGQ